MTFDEAVKHNPDWERLRPAIPADRLTDGDWAVRIEPGDTRWLTRKPVEP